jgi:hypothetical protein
VPMAIIKKTRTSVRFEFQKPQSFNATAIRRSTEGLACYCLRFCCATLFRGSTCELLTICRLAKKIR